MSRQSVYIAIELEPSAKGFLSRQYIFMSRHGWPSLEFSVATECGQIERFCVAT